MISITAVSCIFYPFKYHYLQDFYSPEMFLHLHVTLYYSRIYGILMHNCIGLMNMCCQVYSFVNVLIAL